MDELQPRKHCRVCGGELCRCGYCKAGCDCPPEDPGGEQAATATWAAYRDLVASPVSDGALWEVLTLITCRDKMEVLV